MFIELKKTHKVILKILSIHFRRKSMFEKFFKFGFIAIMFGYLTIIGILITFGLKFLF